MNKLTPKTKDELNEIIQNEIKLHGNECDLNHIDVSNVINMFSLFFESPFNGNISQWDVSNVTNMSSMFSCSQFNGDISHWDVRHVKSINAMFYSSKFNGDISKWKPISIKISRHMFLDNPCSPPYWYSENPEQIKLNIENYKLAQELEKQLITQEKDNIKVKI